MLMEGVVLGGLTLAASVFTFRKLPVPVKKFVLRHPLFTDVVLVVFFYEVFGMTIIAHVACATMAIGAMAMCHIARKPDEYQFLFDALKRGQDQVDAAFAKLREMNKEYLAEQQAKKEVLTPEVVK